jgi:hypothetical protein
MRAQPGMQKRKNSDLAQKAADEYILLIYNVTDSTYPKPVPLCHGCRGSPKYKRKYSEPALKAAWKPYNCLRPRIKVCATATNDLNRAANATENIAYYWLT